MAKSGKWDKFKSNNKTQTVNQPPASTQNTNAQIERSSTEDSFTNPMLNTIGKQISGVSELIKGELLTNILKWNDGLQKRLERSDEKTLNLIQDFNKNINLTRRYIDQATGVVLQNIDNSSRPLTDNVNRLVDAFNKSSHKQKIFNDSLSGQLSAIEKGIKDVRESTDTIQSVPRKIDELTEMLSAKGLQFKAELPAINHEEETYAQLVEYGEKILQQLAIAARWYARKLPELEKHEETMRNAQAAYETEKARAKQDGEELGRKKVIKELLERYGETGAAIHALMEPDENADPRLKILADFLKNQGVETVYDIDQEIEITADTRMKYEPYIANIGNLAEGKIVITAPTYMFDDKIFKASYMTAAEFLAAQEVNQPTNDAAPSDDTAATSADDNAESAREVNQPTNYNAPSDDTAATSAEDNAESAQEVNQPTNDAAPSDDTAATSADDTNAEPARDVNQPLNDAAPSNDTAATSAEDKSINATATTQEG